MGTHQKEFLKLHAEFVILFHIYMFNDFIYVFFNHWKNLHNVELISNNKTLEYYFIILYMYFISLVFIIIDIDLCSKDKIINTVRSLQFHLM